MLLRGFARIFLTREEPLEVSHLPVVMLRNHDCARRKDPQTYSKNTEILEHALAIEGDKFLISGHRFYLA